VKIVQQRLAAEEMSLRVLELGLQCKTQGLPETLYHSYFNRLILYLSQPYVFSDSMGEGVNASATAGYRLVFDRRTQVLSMHSVASPYADFSSRSLIQACEHVERHVVGNQPLSESVQRSNGPSGYLKRNLKLTRKRRNGMAVLVQNAITQKSVLQHRSRIGRRAQRMAFCVRSWTGRRDFHEAQATPTS
jgi:hypothetical protein